MRSPFVQTNLFQKKVDNFLSHLDRVGYVEVDRLDVGTMEIALWLLARKQLKEETMQQDVWAMGYRWDGETLILKRA